MNREDVEKLVAMNKAFKLLRERQKENIKRYPEIESIAKKIRSVRERSIGNRELLSESIENFEKKGFDVYLTKNKDDAIKVVTELLEGERVVVKSKSNVAKEIGLREELENRGVEVVETDIGDRIIQILNEDASHPTGPAAHLSVKMIAEKLSNHFKTEIVPSAEKIVEVLREDIKKRVEKAAVGITGANAITREGAIVVIHNEGNIYEVMHRPKKWIILTGIDKVYPSLEDAVAAAKVQSFFATGEILPSFIEIISGHAKTADIEKKLIKSGSPENIALILLDNGRGEISASEFKEILYCIGCGNCVANCPAHSVYGSRFAGGRFALVDAIKGDKDILRLCLSCKKCKKNCPMEIDIPRMISSLREGSELYNFLISHAMWLNEKLKVELLRMAFRFSVS
ncbi:MULTISPECIES: LUD domain-containing protein [unclassified Archaeoglobus]|uniref:LUD domain-containing protein n=1 Tax=unclassified Archaeoglobus TaxID=2643606 RepID=UPI0025C73737|nr:MULTISPECIES: LUD domain-containing protein [unclassified Archaeoglobus]